jgi:predicted phage tail protein
LKNSDDDYFIVEPELLTMNISSYKEVHFYDKIGGKIFGIDDAIIFMVIMMVISVTMSMLMMPSMPNPDQAAQEAATKNSFLFNGAVNTVEQGGPVPLVYGRAMVGSTVISSELLTADI